MSGSESSQNSGVLPLEALSAEQREIVKELRELAGVTGVTIGAVRGTGGNWDIRPLVQSGRATILVRASAPSDPLEDLNAASSTVADNLGQLQESLTTWFASDLGRHCDARWGTDASGRRLWITRAWLPAGYQVELSETDFLSFVERLALMHGTGFGHGHLSRSNLFRAADGSIAVLDPCIHWFTESDRAAEDKRDIRAGDLQELVELAPPILKARTQSAVTTGRLGVLVAARPSTGTSINPNTSSKTGTSSSAAIPSSASAAAYTSGTASYSSSAGHSQSWSPESAKNSYQQVSSQYRSVALSRMSWVQIPWLSLRIVIAVLTIGAGGYYWWEARELIPRVEAQELWTSGQPSLMSRVAVAAVKGQRSAQTIIVKSAQEGKLPEGLVAQRIITVGFDPRWEAQLSKSDRSLLFRIALQRLLPTEFVKDIPELKQVHPAILLSAVADLDLNNPAPFTQGVSTERFTELGGNVGISFKALVSAGVSTLNEPAARALCRLIGGNTSKDNGETEIRTVLLGSGAGARLRALLPLFANDPKLARAGLTVIANGKGVLTELLRWLGSDPSAGWSKAQPLVILGILAGVPSDNLGIEQWADLVSFPEKGVRQAAAVALAQKYLPQEAELVTLLAVRDLSQGDRVLSRISTASLIAALALPVEEQTTLISRWFNQAPPVTAVKELLMVRQNAPTSDPFNLEAARYLNAKAGTTFSIPEIRRLTQYREPLVRALAYSQLTATDEEQRKILEEAGEQEADGKLRDGLLERLSEYARTEATLSTSNNTR